MQIGAVLETCLYAFDLDSAEAFYRDVLGLVVYSTEPGRHAFFRCGSGMLLVFNPDATSTDNVVVNGVRLPAHGAHGAGHAAFRVPEREVDSWRERLIQRGVTIEAQVEWPNGGRSIYFRDPAGNSVELATPSLWELDEE